MLHMLTVRNWRQGWLVGGLILVLSSTLPAATKTEPAPQGSLLPAAAPTYNLRQVEFINGQIRQGWESHGLAPSEGAPDNEWCRRVFLDVLGRVPTVGELQRFRKDPSPDRKVKLVSRLLGDEYAEDYAQNWTTLWTNILIGRKGGTERRTLISRDGLKQSLRRAFERNVPYDKVVYDIVSATGRSAPGEENFNGFVNFLGGNLAENGVEATAKTAQIFLGVQVRCTQCHNHPFNEFKQNQFWEMNAFFRQTKVLRTKGGKKGRETEYIDLVNQDFAGEDNRPQDAALFYELRNGRMQVAYPVFLDGTRLKESGYLSDVDRRTELARLMVKSDYLGRAVVNRYWAHFLGYGFTKPIDDMGPHNVPSHPELLAGLARAIKTHSYDLKQLIRWLVLSEPYALSSRLLDSNCKDDPALGEKPMFSHFYLRQMRAEELFESLLVATEGGIL